MKKEEKSHRIRFNMEEIDAIIRVASVLNNKELGINVIANFGHIVSKLYKIKEKYKK